MDLITNLQKSYYGLSKRERSIVSITLLALLAFVIYSVSIKYDDFLQSNQVKLERRLEDLEQLPEAISRYKALASKFETLEESLASSKMTVEAVTKEVDKIVKEALGSSDYIFDTLPRNDDDRLMGRFQRQQYKVTIEKLNLAQLVKLLHSLEQGRSPLFIEEIELPRIKSKDEFKVTLFINSILEEV